MRWLRNYTFCLNKQFWFLSLLTILVAKFMDYAVFSASISNNLVSFVYYGDGFNNILSVEPSY